MITQTVGFANLRRDNCFTREVTNWLPQGVGIMEALAMPIIEPPSKQRNRSLVRDMTVGWLVSKGRGMAIND